MTASTPRRPLAQGLRRGLGRHCPNCGVGPLYRAYLKVQPCPICAQRNDRYPADDAPPYFTILLVGHLIVGPLALATWIWPAIWEASVAVILAVILPLLLGLTLLLLPVVKGGVIGALWATRGD